MALTQMQIAIKYDVKLPDVSVALNNGAVDPVGMIEGVKRKRRVYNDEQAKQAIVDLYMSRADKYYQKYREWVRKADAIRTVEADA